MMNFFKRKHIFQQHIPAMVGGTEPQKIKFRTIQKLLENPLFDSYKKWSNFYRFSINKYGYDERYTLMLETKDGQEWWVVGYLSKDTDVSSLPEWKPAPLDLSNLTKEEKRQRLLFDSVEIPIRTKGTTK